MKRIALSLIVVMLAVCAYGQEVKVNAKIKSADGPVFAWDKTEHDFGKIKQNAPVTYQFTFTNTGKAPLIISTVQASCGCTIADYSRDPIMPNGTGFVKATYNAATLGQFTKTVTVNANTEEGIVKLTIKGEVVSGEVAP